MKLRTDAAISELVLNIFSCSLSRPVSDKHRPASQEAIKDSTEFQIVHVLNRGSRNTVDKMWMKKVVKYRHISYMGPL